MWSVVVDDFAVDGSCAQRLDGGGSVSVWQNTVYPVEDVRFGGLWMMVLVGRELSGVEAVGLAH